MLSRKRHGAGDHVADARLLREVASGWSTLALDLARQDRDVSGEEIGRAARRAIEGLVFLHLCRQRGLDEPPRELLDEPSARFSIPDDLLQAVGHRLLSHPPGADGPAWPPETLGWVHQRLLGQRLTRGADGRTTVEPHRATRKNAGVFYTPSYVCRYIAQRAIVEDWPVPCRVLDPACGGGAFLLAAYRRLREIAGQHHAGLEPEALAGSLHGVDVDPEAVRVARRSLWLEARADGLSEGAACRLAAGVHVGDTLVDSIATAAGPFDVVLGNPPYRRELHTKGLLDMDRIAATEFGRRYRMPRMDLWYYFLHRGLELLRSGGRLSFIVGAYWTKGRGAKRLIDALRAQAHLEEIFELGRLQVFSRVAGQHLILTLTKGPARGPTTVKTVDRNARGEAEPFLGGRAPVVVFQKTADQLFHGAGIDLEPPGEEALAGMDRFPTLERLGLVRQGIAENPATVTRRVNEQHGNRWTVGEGVFVLTADELARLSLPEAEAALIRPYHDLCDLGRYRLAEEPSRWLIYATAETWPEVDRYPVLRRHLERFRPILERRRETRLGRRPWWQLHWPRDEALWQASKLLCVQMARRPALAPALRPVYVPFSVNVFVPGRETREHLYYFAALLNSRLLWHWYRHHAKRRGVGLEINGHVLARSPIRPIDFSSPADAARHDRLVELVGRRLLSPAWITRLRAGPCRPASGAARPGSDRLAAGSDRLAAGSDRLVAASTGDLIGPDNEEEEEEEEAIDGLVSELYGLAV